LRLTFFSSAPPLHWNAESIALHNKIFYTQADNKRQAIDKERKEIVSQEDLSLLSPHDRFLREYVFRDAARYWHDPSFDCSDLWQDIEVDESIDLWFSKILPAINVRENLQNIQCPLYIAAGLSDFDCCPYLWENEKRMPPKTQIEKYCSSGHYPHYEESPLFDKNVVKWVQENIL
jgi:pimeloyl-ACP methyl ester carboxylesterase